MIKGIICTIEVPPLNPAVQAAIYGCYSCPSYMGVYV